MDPKSRAGTSETIVSGFLFLVAALIAVARMLSLHPTDFGIGPNAWKELSAAQVAVVSVAVLGGSLVFGALAGRLLSDGFSLMDGLVEKVREAVRRQRSLTKKAPVEMPATADPKDVALLDMLSSDPPAIVRALDARYSAKCFFRSLFVGWSLLCLASAPFTYSSPVVEVAHTCQVCFWVDEIALLVAYLTQRRSLNSLHNALNLRHKCTSSLAPL